MPPEDDLVVELPSDVVTLSDAVAPNSDDGKGAASQKLDASDEYQSRIDVLQREREEAKLAAEELGRRSTAVERQLREESARRLAAEETVAKRTQQAMSAHWGRLQSDHQQILGAIDGAKDRERMAHAAYVSARNEGDASKEADAMARLADAKSAMAQLETGRIAAEGEIARTKQQYADYEAEVARSAETRLDSVREEPVKKEPRAPTADEWIESAKGAIGDSGVGWLRDNKQFVTDTKLNRKFLRFADDYADDHGAAALRTDSFRRALQDKFFPDKDDVAMSDRKSSGGSVEAEPEKAKARIPASAPVSRGGSVFSSRNPDATQVRLPPKLAAFVKSAGLNPTTYAIQAVKDIKEGKLPKNFLDPDYDHTV